MARQISGKVRETGGHADEQAKPDVGEKLLHLAGEGSRGPCPVLLTGWRRRNDDIVSVELEDRQLSTTGLAIQQEQPEAEVLPGCSTLPQPEPQPRTCTIAEDFACRATDQSTCWVSGVN